MLVLLADSTLHYVVGDLIVWTRQLNNGRPIIESSLDGLFIEPSLNGQLYILNSTVFKVHPQLIHLLQRLNVTMQEIVNANSFLIRNGLIYTTSKISEFTSFDSTHILSNHTRVLLGTNDSTERGLSISTHDIQIISTLYTITIRHDTNSTLFHAFSYADVELFSRFRMADHVEATVSAMIQFDNTLLYQQTDERYAHRIKFGSVLVKAFESETEFNRVVALRQLFPIAQIDSGKHIRAFYGKKNHASIILTSRNFPLVPSRLMIDGRIGVDVSPNDRGQVSVECKGCLMSGAVSDKQANLDDIVDSRYDCMKPLLEIHKLLLTIESPSEIINVNFRVILAALSVLAVLTWFYLRPVRISTLQKKRKKYRKKDNTQATLQLVESARNPAYSTPPQRPGPSPNLVISSTVLGTGSHGTIVFLGSFQTRPVAIKRLLVNFNSLAEREIALLNQTDSHPNIIRYFYHEQCESFIYIALELFTCSLADAVCGEDVSEVVECVRKAMCNADVCRDIFTGVQHLHSVSILHADINPRNVLLKMNGDDVVCVVSDFGVCKTSKAETYSGIIGSGGWVASECLTGGRVSAKIDVFSCGCLVWFVDSGGMHPFGDRLERDGNILKGEFMLGGTGQECVRNLVSLMIAKDADVR